MEHTQTYSSLLLIVLLAVFVPILINKIKFIPIPLVVGEIIAGMIVGKSGFNLIESTSWLDFLSTFGFVFLMFLSGLEIDFDLLIKNGSSAKISWYQKPPALAAITFLLTLTLAAFLAAAFYNLGWIKNIPLMTLIMSTTSLGIVVPILKEKGLLSSAYGQTLLFAALIADFVTMVLITIYVTLYLTGLNYKILFIVLLFLVFFIFYRMGIRVVRLKIFEEMAHATSQLEVRGAFALILIFIALTQQLGIEVILGAFLAGVIIALIREKDPSQLNMKLDAIGYGFFIPIFFITVGAQFDIRSVIGNKDSLYLLGALLAGSYLVKIIPALLLKFNHSWQETIGAGFLLSSRLSLIIAASAISLKLEAISAAVNGAIILVAIITCTLSPLLFEPFAPKTDKTINNKIYIIGINERSLLLAQRLTQSNYDLVLITQYQERFKKAKKNFPNVLLGNYLNVQWLKSTGLEEARTVVISSLTEDINTELCHICNKIFQKDHIVLLTNAQSEPDGAKLYGALYVSPELATIFMAENLVTHPQVFSLLSHTDEACDIGEIRLTNPGYFNKPLREVKLPGDSLILSIVRNGEKIIPHGNTTLQENDLLMLVGSCECISRGKNRLQDK
ncbi:MAG: monovalent cation:proton antiporter family protein [Peptococcaceae bacterium]